MRKVFIHTLLKVFLFTAPWYSGLVASETVICGLKTVTVQSGSITQIKHEDGTVHTGGSVSNNWTYNGSSIKHRLFGDPIPCGTKPKTRDETIEELSSRFVENPAMYDMTLQEAELMTSYTASLMRNDDQCHLLVDASKSTSRKGMFFIDCNDLSSTTRRFWISETDLANGSLIEATAPVSETAALQICSQELKARTTNPSTYDSLLITQTLLRH